MDHFDPALTNGAAYYADTEDLAQFLEDLKNEPEFHIKASNKPVIVLSMKIETFFQDFNLQ